MLISISKKTNAPKIVGILNKKANLEASFKDTTMDYDLMMKKSKELEELTNSIDNKMSRWMELEEKMG